MEDIILKHKIKFDRVHKQEPVSNYDLKVLEHSRFGDKVVRRSAFSCLGTLTQFKSGYTKNGRIYFYLKSYESKIAPTFLLSEYFKNTVRCFIIWNFSWGRYFDYNDFCDAMYYNFVKNYRIFIPSTEELRAKEERSVRAFVRTEINHLRYVGHLVYRQELMDKHPEYFVSSERQVFRCLDSSLSREQKIESVWNHKRKIADGIYDSFAKRVSSHPNTLMTWFSKRVDSQGFTRICFSEKAVRFLNERRTNNGLKPVNGIKLFNDFCHRLKIKSGDPDYNIRIFIARTAVSTDNEKLIKSIIKKTSSKFIVSKLERYLKKGEPVYVRKTESEDAIDFHPFFSEPTTYGCELRVDRPPIPPVAS